MAKTTEAKSKRSRMTGSGWDEFLAACESGPDGGTRWASENRSQFFRMLAELLTETKNGKSGKRKAENRNGGP